MTSEDGTPDSKELLAPAEHRLMALLVTGVTDDDAATHLGWSRRSVGRQLLSAMEKLDAHSRIQVGYRFAHYEGITDGPD